MTEQVCASHGVTFLVNKNATRCTAGWPGTVRYVSASLRATGSGCGSSSYLDEHSRCCSEENEHCCLIPKGWGRRSLRLECINGNFPVKLSPKKVSLARFWCTCSPLPSLACAAGTAMVLGLNSVKPSGSQSQISRPVGMYFHKQSKKKDF